MGGRKKRKAHMFGRRLVDTEVAEWQFDGFAWLIDNYSSAAGLPDSRLFLPIDEYFPGNDGQSTTQAEHFFWNYKGPMRV